MHEYSIVSALLDRVKEEAERHRAASVSRLSVRIGDESGVVADLVAYAFEILREGTLCASAELAIDRVAARWSCPACGSLGDGDRPLWCTKCDGPRKLEAGDEIILDRIEMEVP